MIRFVDQLSDFLEEAGLYGELLLKLRKISLEAEEKKEFINEKNILQSIRSLADVFASLGNYEKSEKLHLQCLSISLVLFFVN